MRAVKVPRSTVHTVVSLPPPAGADATQAPSPSTGFAWVFERGQDYTASALFDKATLAPEPSRETLHGYSLLNASPDVPACLLCSRYLLAESAYMCSSSQQHLYCEQCTVRLRAEYLKTQTAFATRLDAWQLTNERYPDNPRRALTPPVDGECPNCRANGVKIDKCSADVFQTKFPNLKELLNGREVIRCSVCSEIPGNQLHLYDKCARQNRYLSCFMCSSRKPSMHYWRHITEECPAILSMAVIRLSSNEQSVPVAVPVMTPNEIKPPPRKRGSSASSSAYSSDVEILSSDDEEDAVKNTTEPIGLLVYGNFGIARSQMSPAYVLLVHFPEFAPELHPVSPSLNRGLRYIQHVHAIYLIPVRGSNVLEQFSICNLHPCPHASPSYAGRKLWGGLATVPIEFEDEPHDANYSNPDLCMLSPVSLMDLLRDSADLRANPFQTMQHRTDDLKMVYTIRADDVKIDVMSIFVMTMSKLKNPNTWIRSLFKPSVLSVNLLIVSHTCSQVYQRRTVDAMEIHHDCAEQLPKLPVMRVPQREPPQLIQQTIDDGMVEEREDAAIASDDDNASDDSFSPVKSSSDSSESHDEPDDDHVEGFTGVLFPEEDAGESDDIILSNPQWSDMDGDNTDSASTSDDSGSEESAPLEDQAPMTLRRNNRAFTSLPDAVRIAKPVIRGRAQRLFGRV